MTFFSSLELNMLSVSFCNRWMFVMCHQQLLQTTSPKQPGLILTELGGNDPYMAFLDDCSNGSSLLLNPVK